MENIVALDLVDRMRNWLLPDVLVVGAAVLLLAPLLLLLGCGVWVLFRFFHWAFDGSGFRFRIPTGWAVGKRHGIGPLPATFQRPQRIGIVIWICQEIMNGCNALRRRNLKCLITYDGIVVRKEAQQGDGHPPAVSVIELDIHFVLLNDVPRT